MSIDKAEEKEWKHAENKASQRIKEIAEEVRLMTNYLENNFEIDMEKHDPNGYACNAYTLTSKDKHKREYGPFRSIEDAYRFIIWCNLEQNVPILEIEDYQVRVRRKGEEKKISRHSRKDHTKYRFKGEPYSKRRLVLAVIKDWVESNKPLNIEELRKVFPQNIAPNGTFAPLNEANDIRYFTGESDRIHFDDETCYVISGEWGGVRHKRFVEVARDLGCDIEEVA